VPRRLSALEKTSLLVAASSLFGALGASLWDPPEVENAELARRIAQGLFGAGGLASGEGVPTRGELGKGELPFLAMAAGFRLFGLEPWAGRLPLALFAAAGVLALFIVVKRLASRRAACLAVLALATTPLYYLQARTLLGDITTLSATVLGLSGHALFVFDDQSRARRLFGLGLAALGAVTGFFARGALLGVAPAALGVGVTWLALSLAGEVQAPATRRAGAITVAVGIAALGTGAFAWFAIPFERYSLWIGSTRSAYPQPTFEAGLRQFLHAGFPWSALALPALGQVLLEATRASPPSPRAKLGFAAVMTAVSAWALETALTPSFGPLPGCGLPMLAIVVGLALDERPTNTSRALLGVGAACIAVLLVWDFFHLPDKLLVSVGAPLGTLPETWDPHWFGLGAGATFVGFGIAALFLAESGDEAARSPAFAVSEYAGWFRVLRDWHGGLAGYVLLAVGAAALGLDLALAIGTSRATRAATSIEHWGVRALWLAALAAAIAPVLWLAARDLARLAVRTLRLERGTAAACALAGPGLAGSLAVWPALSFELPENAALAAYQKRAQPGDELGLLHGALPAARYLEGERVSALGDVDQALKFLEPRGSARRFVALAPSDLGALNAACRARTTPRRNLPVVDVTADTWLVASRLAATELDLNPLRATILGARPAEAARVLDGELGHALGLLGWELRDREGVVRSEVIAGEWYDLYLYFEVRSRLDRAWRIFVHVDGFQQRFNADHEPVGASYPTDLWLPGDWVVDRHRVRIDTELAPGSYSVYAGMHIGEERLPVTRGSAGADRIFLGALRVD
jgi:4-amino-4-deoxy-L-arabinose transferase-like glycosyltransferase